MRVQVVLFFLVTLAGVGCAVALPANVTSPERLSTVGSLAPSVELATTLVSADERSRSLVELPNPVQPGTTLIRGATMLTGTGIRYSPGFLLIRDGMIVSVGNGDGVAPDGATIVDARGLWLTPGLIDTHSHMGVYPSPSTSAHNDGNEMTDPVTAGLFSEHSFWPEDPAIERAVAGGVTTAAILPGSGNLIGGRGVTLHLVPTRGARAMRFPGAPEILKMACGENPKRVYGEMKRIPSTRMGNVFQLRLSLVKAQRYQMEWNDYERKRDEPNQDPSKPVMAPARDLTLDTLSLLLSGNLLVQWHCYQADDMLAAIQVSKEFGFRVRSFHHALEAYKIRDILAREEISVSTWADAYGFKMEAFDGIPENLALVQEAGGRSIVHSDSAVGIQMLNQEAGKALAVGRAAGIDIDEDDAIRWVTANPAWALGIEAYVGTLEPGKRADAVLWSSNPLSVYANAKQVYIDGTLVYRDDEPVPPWSDFELGYRSTIRGIPLP